MLRVTVDTGGLILRYCATPDLAARYQREVERCTGFRVSITDGDVSGLRPVPCERLYRMD
jgi:hypothetical protein